MKKIRVLIVDDCSAVRDGLQSILRAYPDIEVVGEAEDGVEGLAKAEQLQPGVVLMDAQMPEMDGVEATLRIKERFPNIKVLYLTVHTRYIEPALAAGADGYLMKDVGRVELVQAIKTVHEGGSLLQLTTSMEVEQAAEILDLLNQGDLHQAEHEMQELLGEEEHHN